MTTPPATRLDPINYVMHYELLKVAHSLVKRGQDESYWTNMPVPVRPLGRLRFEVAQQVATFAVPLLGWHWAYLHYGLKGLLLGMPAAWLTGWLLDLRLDYAIEAQARREEKRDAGRYRAVKWLCEQMGMRPEEVTLGVIHKMDKDFVIVQRIIDEKMAKLQTEKKAAAAAAVQVRRLRSSSDTEHDRHSAVSVAHSGADHISYEADDGMPTYEPFEVDTAYSFADAYMPAEYYNPTINPASGLPMIENTCFDVHGNTFGESDH